MNSFWLGLDDFLIWYLDVSTELSKNPGTIKANITSDGIIDDDFESELGGHETTVGIFFIFWRIISFVCQGIKRYRRSWL